MMNTVDVYQGKVSFSVPREPFINYIVTNKDLNKKDIRVALLLLTELTGFNPGLANRREDPKIFRKISPKAIAKQLDMTKEEVKDSISTLTKQGIIEEGSSSAVEKGYRFTF